MTKNVLKQINHLFAIYKSTTTCTLLEKKTQKAKTKHIKTTTNINSNIWHKVN